MSRLSLEVFVQDEVAIALHFGFVSLARRPDRFLVTKSFFALILQALSDETLLQSELELFA